MQRLMQLYLIPAAVFMSVIIGGGYGTGREIVEFFSRHGLYGGLFGIALATLTIAIVLYFTFEFARRFKTYDYRGFTGALIGRYWWIFELLFIALFVLVLGVVSSALSNMLHSRYALPEWAGTLIIPLTVPLVIVFGRAFVQNALALWSVLMYVTFFIYFYYVTRTPEHIPEAIPATDYLSAASGGLLYAMYNLAIVPGLLFSVRALSRQKESLIAAFIVAITIMFPAVLFHLSYQTGGSNILNQPLPNYWMIEQFAPDWLLTLFILALLGTLVETAVGLVQSLVERLANTRPVFSRASGRFGIALVAVIVATAFSSLGIIDLIARGYSSMAIGFLLVYVLPILYWGFFKSRKQECTP